MYAVVQTGGKQYRVAKEDVFVVERIAGEAGDTVSLDQVLMVGEAGGGATVGAPLVDKASVTAEIVEQSRDDKIIVFKKQRRQNHRRKHGHRQDVTVLRVTDIKGPGAKGGAAKKASKAKATKAEETSEAADAAASEE